MKKNKTSKIIAFIALFWIIIWIIWTWILIIFWNQNTINNSEWITEEQLQELIRSQSWMIINNEQWDTNINSWKIILEKTNNQLQELSKSQSWITLINNTWSIDSSSWSIILKETE